MASFNIREKSEDLICIGFQTKKQFKQRYMVQSSTCATKVLTVLVTKVFRQQMRENKHAMNLFTLVEVVLSVDSQKL